MIQLLHPIPSNKHKITKYFDHRGIMPIFQVIGISLPQEAFMRKRKFRLLGVILTIFIIASVFLGCGIKNSQSQEQVDFEVFINDVFVLEVQSDTLSLNYSLATPEKYGIKDKNATLGEYSVSSMNSDLTSSENYLSRLLSFDYDKLTSEQQLTYDILKNYFEQDLALGNYTYYQEILGPTTGVQAQLPILLAEYSFHDKDDIDEYIQLLHCVPDYFKDIMEFEREKSARGLFMSNAVAMRIIEQCESFVQNPEENFLISYFDEKISGYEGLTDSEITMYKVSNKEAILAYVIPAYKMMIDSLKELLGTGKNQAGLYYFPEGQAYYEALTKYKTGSDRNMEGIIDLLDKAIAGGVIDITSLSMSDTDLINKYLSFTSFPITDPEEIIADLKKDITKDFPEIIDVNCNIKYVPKSLSKYLSPAMYLVPPMDSYTQNNIYINGNDKETLSMIYTTVAHEGYPGHLYQCVYFRNQNPSPIRNILNFTGYDEGWATYVEMYSYQISGIDKNLARFLQTNNMVILCMYARADIGIHYEGWTKERTVSYVNQFVGDEEVAKSIYATLLEEPAIYLPYAVGYLEFNDLREEAKERLGDQFVAKDFHRFVLDIGPSQFGVLDQYMDQWIETVLK